MEVDDLFPSAETLQLLGFADMDQGDIVLTPLGVRFAHEGVSERKNLFAQQLMVSVPLVAHIRRVLDERDSHTAPKSRFQNELEDYMSEERAEETMRTVISWGRYGELFAYDEHVGAFSLDNPG
jgi:NitT/TauT family transport system ATP-binding protein